MACAQATTLCSQVFGKGNPWPRAGRSFCVCSSPEITFNIILVPLWRSRITLELRFPAFHALEGQTRHWNLLC